MVSRYATILKIPPLARNALMVPFRPIGCALFCSIDEVFLFLRYHRYRTGGRQVASPRHASNACALPNRAESAAYAVPTSQLESTLQWFHHRVSQSFLLNRTRKRANYVFLRCLEKNPEHRPFMEELIEHPFLTQLPENDQHVSARIFAYKIPTLFVFILDLLSLVRLTYFSSLFTILDVLSVQKVLSGSGRVGKIHTPVQRQCLVAWTEQDNIFWFGLIVPVTSFKIHLEKFSFFWEEFQIVWKDHSVLKDISHWKKKSLSDFAEGYFSGRKFFSQELRACMSSILS